MLHESTIQEIRTNINPGVEYEIALFYKLLLKTPNEAEKVLNAVKARPDARKVMDIIVLTNENIILTQLRTQRFTFCDVSFETQNDKIGPADLVMYVKDEVGNHKQIGLSVKYANTCTLNVTGRNFITDPQIQVLKNLIPQYTNMYIDEMSSLYGNVSNWFRKRKPSRTTDAFIDKVRDAVIQNWPNVSNKDVLLSTLFHSDSPIEFWVVTYGNHGYVLKTSPSTIERRRANDVTVQKMETSFVAFYLDGHRIGHMQVKFNNGFVEKCKKSTPDVVCQGVYMSFGRPFSSWNFSVES